MARLRPLGLDEVDPRVRGFLAQDVERYGFVSPTSGVYSYAPTVFEGAKALDAGITQAGGIPRQLRALVNLRVAAQVGCPF